MKILLAILSLLSSINFQVAQQDVNSPQYVKIVDPGKDYYYKGVLIKVHSAEIENYKRPNTTATEVQIWAW